MAAIQFTASLSAPMAINNTTLTALQIVTPTNQRVKVTQIFVSFDGTNSASAPAQIFVERQTTGTVVFTNNNLAPKKINDPTGSLETIQTTFNTVQSSGTPTSGDLLQYFTVPVFGGTLIYPLPPSQELIVPGGTKLGIRITTTSTVNAYVSLICEE